MLVVPIGKWENDIGLAVVLVGVRGLSFGGTGGGPEPAETLRPLPLPRPRIDKLENRGIDGRPIEDELDRPEKLLPVGDGGGDAFMLDSRVMGLLDVVGRDDSADSSWGEVEPGLGCGCGV